MKRSLGILAAFVAVFVIGANVAQAKPATSHEFKLPASAKLMTDGSYSLGKKIDPTTGKEVEGIAYLHPKKQAAKVKAKPGGGTACYAYITNGLKWKTVENWQLDPANNQGLTADFLLSNTTANISKWETAAGNPNIFGTGSLATGLTFDETTVNGANEVMFGAIDEPGVIAVTLVWGYYNVPTRYREIVEWDQVYDQQDFVWSAAGESGKMDFNNISTHEIGHAAGMGHPGSACTNETMYAYATEGETKKQTLNAGDIAGINALY